EHADVVAFFRPRPGERVAEEPGAAGDDDLHGRCWTDADALKFGLYNVISSVPTQPTRRSNMRLRACAALALLLAAASAAPAQEKTVPVPPNVKVDGMPAIPQAIADGLAPYAQFRSAQMQAWHPAKRQLVINTTFASPQFHLIDGPGRDRRQLTWMAGAGISPQLTTASFDPVDGNT